jgi:hypothetical protein
VSVRCHPDLTAAVAVPMKVALTSPSERRDIHLQGSAAVTRRGGSLLGTRSRRRFGHAIASTISNARLDVLAIPGVMARTAETEKLAVVRRRDDGFRERAGGAADMPNLGRFIRRRLGIRHLIKVRTGAGDRLCRVEQGGSSRISTVKRFRVEECGFGKGARVVGRLRDEGGPPFSDKQLGIVSGQI